MRYFQSLIGFVLCLVLCIFISCSEKVLEVNRLEIELNTISEDAPITELQGKVFNNFKIDWENPDQWESDCSHYNILPKVDTFNYHYYLDVCYKKYRWWSKTEKQ